MSGLGKNVTLKLLTEAQGHPLTIELITGDTYKGKLLENEDNMNLTLYDVEITKNGTGQTSHKKQVFVRGSMVRFISLPDQLKASPLLNMKSTPRPKAPLRGPPPKRARY